MHTAQTQGQFTADYVLTVKSSAPAPRFTQKSFNTDREGKSKTNEANVQERLTTCQCQKCYTCLMWQCETKRSELNLWFFELVAAQSCDSVGLLLNVGFAPVYTPRRMNCSFPIQRHRLVRACQRPLINNQTLRTFQSAWLTKLKIDDITQTKGRRKP